MLTTLRKIAGGTAIIPMRARPHHGDTASLRKELRCRICGSTLRLARFVPLTPSGIRGYYSDARGHIVAIDRSHVTRSVGSDPHRIYFA